MTKNKTLFGALALTACLSAAYVGGVAADELQVPVGSQADRTQIDIPKTGLSQSSVRAKWGAPSETRGPVGEPPISQWHYPAFVVYFENDTVLHTVVKHKR